ncbi:hypothetical protein ES708_09476 [subsurface metagenome]
MKRELWYSVVVRDRHGKVISREHRKSKSFLKAWNQLVYVQMKSEVTGESIVDTDGVSQSITAHTYNFAMNAAAGTITYGIRVGTGNTPVAIDDYALDAPIAEGTGVDEMNHLVCTVATSVVAAPSCSFLVSRAITNNSGSEITVREAGIHAIMKVGVVGLITRDVFVTPQAVPNGGTITIDWTLQVTV